MSGGGTRSGRRNTGGAKIYKSLDDVAARLYQNNNMGVDLQITYKDGTKSAQLRVAHEPWHISGDYGFSKNRLLFEVVSDDAKNKPGWAFNNYGHTRVKPLLGSDGKNTFIPDTRDFPTPEQFKKVFTSRVADALKVKRENIKSIRAFNAYINNYESDRSRTSSANGMPFGWGRFNFAPEKL